ncbi:MAG: Uma2 family endonuclease [Planctomycetaceae bacterium]|nr:Uma2 family endonuclease [Planctomycetaceae bacterium]
MVTIVESGTRASALEQRFLLRDVGWEGYETMLKLVGDRPIRLTYDRGDLELMSPSLEHEEYRELLDLLVWLVAAGLRIPCRGAGLTTWRRRAKDRGLEADACFYLASFPRVSGKRTKIDLEVDPPPDLAIEVEISRSTLGRMGIYAALGVPEVWRFDGEALRVEQLQADGTYTTVANSRSFPFLAPEEVVRWVRLAETIEDRGEWLRQLQDWIREELAPRLGGG